MNDINEEIKEMSQKVHKIVCDWFKEVLDYTGCTEIRWTQYTPWFNDGEPCIFNVGYLTFIHPDYKDPICLEYDEYDQISEEHDNLFTSVSKIFCNIKKHILLDMFGDHVEVEVTKDGIVVEEYIHD